ncbi:MAG: hypothetical protein AB1641_27555 [Thermodesulfobacteriota bacterium]
MKSAGAILLLLSAGLAVLAGCSLFQTEELKLPDNPVERAAILGVYNSFRESTMWEIREPRVLSVQPMAPTKAFVQEHDPKELYCVCVRYEARYKVPWATKDSSQWEESVRNILVMKNRSDQFLAMRPAAICPPFCQ